MYDAESMRKCTCGQPHFQSFGAWRTSGFSPLPHPSNGMLIREISNTINLILSDCDLH